MRIVPHLKKKSTAVFSQPITFKDNFLGSLYVTYQVLNVLQCVSSNQTMYCVDVSNARYL